MLPLTGHRVLLNGTWEFQPLFSAENALPPPTDDGWSDTPLIVPSPWNGNAWGGWTDPADPDSALRCDGVYYPSYPADWIHAPMGWLRRRVRFTPRTGERVNLHFEAVAGCAEVYVNGTAVGTHFDSWLPFDCDVTDALREGENEILVGVRAARLFDRQSTTYRKMRCPYPTGSNTDGLCGIWQDVWLETRPALRVSDLFVQPWADEGLLRCELTLVNDSPVSCRTTPSVTVGREGQTALTLSGETLTLAAGETRTVALDSRDTAALRRWSPESPVLYEACAALNGRASLTVRFGWRQFRQDGERLLLNGRPIRLVGDICHPFGPYMFRPEWIRSWYRLIQSVGGNAVRLHAQIYPSLFLDIADEMGICVLDETAFFGSNLAANLEEPSFWERANAHYDGLVRRDRNHPCVFGWSCGNELFALFLYDEAASRDQDAFYEKLIPYAQRARVLDPTRDFITCDGDEDLRGSCPVWSKHFGHGLRDLPPVRKPKVVGENGGTYYARPGDLAMFNGEEAYRSYAGRNQALGIDLYAQMRHLLPDLVYFSPSELVWFGLEPLPYGYRDFTRLPTRADGIFFPPPADGVSGLWMERLPPFAGTLNPGWDETLPAMRPLAMVQAMREALTFDPAFDARWQPRRTALPAPPLHPVPRRVRFIGDENGRCAALLRQTGLILSPDGEDALVDGETAAAPPADGTGAGGVTLVLLDERVPAGIEATLTGRRATQLERAQSHPFIDSLSIADMYTAEETPRLIARHGIQAENAAVLLTAGEADWSQFHNVPERVKCGAALLHERLQKPAGAVLVRLADGRYATTARLENTPSHMHFWRRLFANIGWALRDEQPPAEALPADHDLLLNGPVS